MGEPARSSAPRGFAFSGSVERFAAGEFSFQKLTAKEFIVDISYFGIFDSSFVFTSDDLMLKLVVIG